MSQPVCSLLGVVLAHLLMYRARLWARQSPRRDPGRRQRRRVRERVLLLAATAAMAVSGLVQWAEVGDAEHWHAATSAILVLLAGRHAWSRRRLVHRGGHATCRHAEPASPMSSPVSKVNQFGFPHGPLGHLVGLVMRHGNADMEQAAIDALELHGNEHVLEIGSGPGVGLRLLADRLPGGRVAGLDPSPVMVAQARRLLASQPHVEMLKGAVPGLPWLEEAFDAVISVNNVMLWPDPVAGLRAVPRILRPRGQLVLAAHTWVLRRSIFPGAADDTMPAGLVQLVTAAGYTSPRAWLQPRRRGTGAYLHCVQ